MNSGENIHNAVVVLQKSYENISKLLSHCQAVAQRSTSYRPAVTKFLRYRSDMDWNGWMIPCFILLFQHKEDEKLKNGWRNGAVYGMEINLEDEPAPKVYLSQFEYEEISSWSAGCSPASCWVFTDPVHSKDMERTVRADGITAFVPAPSMSKEIADTYWGLTKITAMELPLASLTAENTQQLVFGGFEKLRNLSYTGLER